MGQLLKDIAKELRDKNKKVQLIYAFNGTGKTRLSRELKELIDPKPEQDGDDAPSRSSRKILYYNAFTEDLFYWDNDLDGEAEPKLNIQPNSFTNWIFKDQGQENNITRNFQHYTDDKLTPQFNENFSEVRFSLERGTDERLDNLKISKGEESNLIWSIFYVLLEQAVSILNDKTSDRETDQFDSLKYVVIDDPVTSLDENHLIELAVNLAGLIKGGPPPDKLQFIIMTHSPFFYNVLHNELNGRACCYLLERNEDGSFSLIEKKGDSNQSFSYHLYLKRTLEKAVAENQIEKYHFTLLRNLYEKTASFLGYPEWSELLPDDKKTYLNRIIQFTSHSTLSNETVAEPAPEEKQIVKFLLEYLGNNYGYRKQEGQHD